MPNWCSNTIGITGPADQITALWQAAQAGEDAGLLQAMVPMPAELDDTVADGGAGMNWYNWRVANWGTKWDVTLEDLELVDNGDGTATITGYADSAWSPPIDAFAAYCEANPQVTAELKYFEPGMSFIGVWSTESGDVYWEDVGEIAKNGTDDTTLDQLMEDFNVWDWYETDDEETVE